MKQILSLDLGTASIGWAVRTITHTPSKEDIDASGVVIFPEVVETNKSGGLFTRAKIRREKRLIRRQYYRRKLRKYATLKILIEAGMTPLQQTELRAWLKPGKDKDGKLIPSKYPLNPEFHRWLRLQSLISENSTCFANIYQLRKDALHDDIQKYEEFGFSRKLTLGRIFYNFSQRRGFLSNAKLKKDDDSGAVKEGISEMKNEMKAGGYNYASELFADTNPMKKRIRVRYLDRQMYYDEFIKLCELYKEVCSDFYDPSKDPTKEIKNQGKRTLANALFRVRPLKSQKQKVGHCTLEPGRRRIHLSHPYFERFRLIQFLQNISIKIGEGEKEKLSLEAQLYLAEKIPLLKDKQHKVDFERLLSEYYGKQTVKISSENKFPCPACPSTYMLINLLGKEWKSLKFKRNVIKSGKNRLKTIGWEELWHYKKENEENPEKFGRTEKPCYEYAAELGLSSEQAEFYEKAEIAKGYASLSYYAIQRILPFLEKGTPYHLSVVYAGIVRVLGKKEWSKREEKLRQDIENYSTIFEEDIVESKCYNSFIQALKEDGILPQEKDIETKLKYLTAKTTWKKWTKKDKSGNSIAQNLIQKILNKINIAAQNEEFNWASFPTSQKEFVENEIKEILKELGITEKKIKQDKLSQLYHHSAIDKWKEPKEIEIKKGDGARYTVKQLQTPYTGAIQNPAAMRCLHEVKKLINYLLREKIIQDPEKTKVVIEMARELNEINKRRAIKEWQERQEQENNNMREFIVHNLNLQNPSEEQINKLKLWLEQTASAAGAEERKQLDKKYLGTKKSSGDLMVLMLKLWKEQKGICLYSGKMLSPTDILNGETQIEHTIPRSISNDTRMENLTLATGIANQKKTNRIPAEITQGGDGIDDVILIRQRLRPWIERLFDLDSSLRWEKIFDGIGWIEDDRAVTKRKYEAKKTGKKNSEESMEYGLIQDTNRRVKTCKISGDLEKYSDAVRDRWLYRFERDYWKQKIERFFIEEVSEGFSRRQLVDTQVITKYACGWLKTTFGRVIGTNGTLTSELRKQWGLQAYHEKKNRTDHTHHMIDAIVNAFVEPQLYDRLAEVYRKKEKGERNIQLPLPWTGFANDVFDRCEQTLVFHVYRDRTLKQTKLKNTSNYSPQNGIKLQLHKETPLGIVRAWKYNDQNELKWDRDELGDFNKVFTNRKSLGDTEEKGKPVFRKLESYAKNKPDELKKGGSQRILPAYSLWTKQGKKIRISDLTEKDLEKIKDNDINNWFLDEVNQFGLDTIKKNGFYIPIKRMRIIKSVIKPLKVRDVSSAFHNSDNPDKHSMYYENSGNYGLLIYKNNSNKKELRLFKMISNFKSKEIIQLIQNELIIEDNTRMFELDHGVKKAKVLSIGKRILLFEKSDEEIWDNMSPENISKRLYKIKGLSVSRPKINGKYYDYAYSDLLIHNSTGKVKSDNNKIADVVQEKGVFLNSDPFIANRCLSHLQINALIEGIDFRLTYDGALIKI
jgi:CRISPR-associated endonuclease Csn1